MSKGQAIAASLASAVARKLTAALLPVCELVEVVGSLRRRKNTVHDVDLVVLPRQSGGGGLGLIEVEGVLASLVAQGSLTPVRGGQKVRSFVATKTQVPIDLYIATKETWATLVLIRTGSKNHNVRLAQRAREMGMKLKASGDGIEGPDGVMIPVQDEREVFALLRLPYVPPESRD